MKVTVLSDNIEGGCCRSEHGLSLYIEYEKGSILLDAGRSELFYENAVRLGIDLTTVQTAILSHSHYDHADGFDTFFEINKSARLYMRAESGEYFYSMHDDGLAYIGPKKGMLEKYKDRIVYVSERVYICPSEPWELIPHSTLGLDKIGEKAMLYRKRDDRLIPDDFSHEQTLVFKTDKGLIIFNSCSHGGPANIIKEVRQYEPEQNIYAYIGGFHLFKSSDEDIKAFGEQLKKLDVKRIITGHCTGDKAYSILKDMLGKRVEQMHAGIVIDI